MTPEARLEWQRQRRAARRARGECVHCGEPATSGSMCERHLAATRAATRAYFDTSKGLMVKAAQERRRRARRRAAEGFQSTGTGKAAFAAFYTDRGGVHG